MPKVMCILNVKLIVWDHSHTHTHTLTLTHTHVCAWSNIWEGIMHQMRIHNIICLCIQRITMPLI